MFRGKRAAVGVFLGSACAFMLLIGSCGNDDNPTTPGPPPPPPENQIPQVPAMTDPDVEPPTRSEVITIIKPARDYAPGITAAYTSLEIESRGRFEEWPTWIDCYGPWQNKFTGTAWTNGGIPPITGCIAACGVVLPFCEINLFYPKPGFDANMSSWPARAPRFVFWKDGAQVSSPEEVVFTGSETEYCMAYKFPEFNCLSKAHIMFRYTATAQALAGTPYLRRDRLWVAQKWESGALVHEIEGEGETRMKTLWMTGSEKSQIETFAWSVGAKIGATGEVLSGAIEASISKTFSTEVTVREATETSVEKVLTGKAGKLNCFMYWALVDRYSFAKADGTRFEDDNYIFDEGYYDPVLDTHFDLEICGVIAERVVRYEFDLATGALQAVAEQPVR